MSIVPAHKTCLTAHPAERFEEVIVGDCDVGGDEVGDGGVRSTKHHIFARSLEFVVLNHDGPRRVVGPNRLCVTADIMEVRYP